MGIRGHYVRKNIMRYQTAGKESSMCIVEIHEGNIAQAGRIHSESWKESHKTFCSAEFVERHSPAAQTEYLRRELSAGKKLFMLTDSQPVGIVSVQGSLIENLYVLPDEQNKGYGTRLLEYAVRQCEACPTLWILNNNERARRFYRKNGFRESGRKNILNEKLYECEMTRKGFCGA